MSSSFPNDADLLRAEIAAAAARLIAEEGADYATAKRKAARQILGNNKVRGDVLPDNAMVEDEVRAYNALFFADTQPARLRHLRELAVRLMRELQLFQPHLTGAVLNGTAGEHSDIHLQLFADSPKDVEIFLLNKGIDFDVSEIPPINGQEDIEVLSFLWHNEGVHLALYETNAQRTLSGGRKTTRVERASLNAVEALLALPDTSPTGK